MNFQKAFKLNQETWNKKVAIHAKSAFYDIERFKTGKSSLNTFELNTLGDVSGKKILHLQCHFGQDTFSLSRLGAYCTGVDFSEEAIALAQKLNNELNLNAQFVCCNVYDTSKYITETFEIVFCSYGVVGWLPDLKAWAKLIVERLQKGGIFYLAEFHPIAWMFDYTHSPPEMMYGYQQKEAIYEEYHGTYADEANQTKFKEYGWNHSLSEIIQNLLDAGLQLQLFQEHMGSPYQVFPELEHREDGLYYLKNEMYPLVFEMKFIKP